MKQFHLQKKLLWLLLPAALLLAAGLYLLLRPKAAPTGNYAERVDSVAQYESHWMSQFENKDGLISHLGHSAGYAVFCADGSKGMVVSDTGLYYYDGTEAGVQLNDDAGFTVLSYDGSTVLYTVATGKTMHPRLLCYRSGKTTEIDYLDQLYAITLSPTGKTACYTAIDGSTVYGHLLKNGRDERFDLNSDYLTAITDDGSLRYYYGLEPEGFYVLTPGGVVTLSPDPESYRRQIYFNCDNTQVLFYDGGDTWLSTDGAEPVCLCEGEAKPVLPYNTQTFTLRDDGLVKALGVKDFHGTFLCLQQPGGDTILRIEPEDTVTPICRDVQSCGLCADGHTLAYLTDRTLCVQDADSGAAQTVLDDAEAFQMSRDGSKLYALLHGELYLCAGGEVRLLDSEVPDPGWLDDPFYSVTGGDTLYYAKPDGLYFEQDGAPKLAVGYQGVPTHVWADAFSVSFFTEDDTTERFYRLLADGKVSILDSHRKD